MNPAGNTALFLLCLSIAAPAPASWSGDPNENNPICTADVDQTSPSIVGDSDGGAIIAWTDNRFEFHAPDIYAQRVDHNGNVLWAMNGVPVCDAADAQRYPLMVADGAGGAFVVWRDEREGNWNIYAQRIDGGGNRLWTADGVLISTMGGGNARPELVSDGAGGIIITWNGAVGSDLNIYAQRLDGDGNPLWSPGAMEISTAANNEECPHLASDGAGGAIIAWEDRRGGGWQDIYAQRVDADGNKLWPPDGAPISTANHYQEELSVLSDGQEGSFICWNDYRNEVDTDIYAQHVGADGMLGDPTSTPTVETAPAFALRGNWPNPFNPRTTIGFELASSGKVDLCIHDIAGRRLRTLLAGRIAAGRHERVWDGRDESGRTLTSGIYLYRLRAGGLSETRRMLLLK